MQFQTTSIFLSPFAQNGQSSFLEHRAFVQLLEPAVFHMNRVPWMLDPQVLNYSGRIYDKINTMNAAIPSRLLTRDQLASFAWRNPSRASTLSRWHLGHIHLLCSSSPREAHVNSNSEVCLFLVKETFLARCAQKLCYLMYKWNSSDHKKESIVSYYMLINFN